MKRKEPTKTFMMISNWINHFGLHGLFKTISGDNVCCWLTSDYLLTRCNRILCRYCLCFMCVSWLKNSVRVMLQSQQNSEGFRISWCISVYIHLIIYISPTLQHVPTSSDIPADKIVFEFQQHFIDGEVLDADRYRWPVFSYKLRYIEGFGLVETLHTVLAV